MKTIKMTKLLRVMKKYLFLLFLLGVGLSGGVWGQKKDREIPKKVVNPILQMSYPLWANMFIHNQAFIPIFDTVIMRGDKIEVGAYLHEKYLKEIEIVGFGKSKKSNLEKGYYVIEQKPKQTITYEIKCSINTPFYLRPVTIKRTVYVAKTEEEKKMYQEMIEKRRLEIRTRGEKL